MRACVRVCAHVRHRSRPGNNKRCLLHGIWAVVSALARHLNPRSHLRPEGPARSFLKRGRPHSHAHAHDLRIGQTVGREKVSRGTNRSIRPVPDWVGARQWTDGHMVSELIRNPSSGHGNLTVIAAETLISFKG